MKVDGSVVTIDSVRTAGSFQMSTMMLDAVRGAEYSDRERAKLTTRIIDLRAKAPMRLADDTAFPTCVVNDADIDVQMLDALHVPDRADRLLAFLAVQSYHLGSRVDVSFPDRPYLNVRLHHALAYSESVARDEVLFLTDHLISKGWVRDVSADAKQEVIVSVEGYERLRELETHETSRLFSRVNWFLDQ